MSDDPAVRLLQSYYAAWGSGDPDLVLRFFAEGSVFEDLAFEARFEGLAAIRGFADLTYAGAPDFEVEPSTVFVNQDGSAAAEWVMRGTHQGDFPGLPATGRRFEVRACSVVHISDGVIRRIQDYWSVDTFRRSVGLL